MAEQLQVEILSTETTTLAQTEMQSTVKVSRTDVVHQMVTIQKIMRSSKQKVTIMQAGNMDVCTAKVKTN
jgi:hypothetical protein